MSRIGKVSKILSLVMGVCAYVPQVGAVPPNANPKVKEGKHSKGVDASLKGLPGVVPLNVKPQIGVNQTGVKPQVKERKRSNSVKPLSKRPLLEVKGKPQMDKVAGPNLDGKGKSQIEKIPVPKSLGDLVPVRGKIGPWHIFGYAGAGILVCISGVYCVYVWKSGDWCLEKIFGKKKKVDKFDSEFGKSSYSSIANGNKKKNSFLGSILGLVNFSKSNDNNKNPVKDSAKTALESLMINQVIYDNSPVEANNNDEKLDV